MKRKRAASLAIMLTAFALISAAVPCTAFDSTISYKLVNPEDGTVTHTLNVVVPETLLEYYNGLGHRSASMADFPKFVTPYALKPIADCLRQIYPEDEDFTNGVLVLVHQIPYQEITPAYYPVETIVRNSGDCDLTALTAASILIAGGLDVVLLHYESETHMNLGVHLSEAPVDARLAVFALQHNEVKYYVAETTSTNWQEGWRVGECPEDLKNIPVQIVTLENSEQVAPGQVSASFRELSSTTLELAVSSTITIEGMMVTLRGQIKPAVPNENITVYWSSNGAPWEVLTTTMTKSNGQFEYSWKPDTDGLVDMLDIRASWTGNQQFAGTTSQSKNIISLSFIILTILAATIALCVTGVVVASKRKPKPPPAPIDQNPIPPSEPPAPQSDAFADE